MIIPVILAAILLALDQLTKHMALTRLKPVMNVTFIDGFMDFTFVENRGAAFGILDGNILLLLAISIAICAVIIFAMVKMPKTKEYKWLKLDLLLILTGAVGNILDRIIRGYVVDFFEFTFIQWPVFNMADIYVVVGTVIMALLVLFVIKEDDGDDDEV
ncbi:lipoprotein signal peptidase [Clostridiales bacterium]|nr:lipoprotein signal peptidase [Clostridiales bacterium]